MKVLVLGSAGQIGAPLVKHLKSNGHTVYEMDIVNDPHWQDLTIKNNVYLLEKVIQCDFIFFLAYDVGGSEYLKTYQHTYDFIHNNCVMMSEVFHTIKCMNKKFVFASSQMSNMNFSPYGVLKRIGEYYTQSLNGLFVHFWNVYGYEADPEKYHVISDFIRKGLDTGKIEMRTDGQEERDFLYVGDCCKALESIMINYDHIDRDEKLHITTGEFTKIIDIAKIIQSKFESVGKSVEVVPSLNKDTVQQYVKNTSSTYIRKWWKPETTIEQGISNIFDITK